MTKNEQFSLLCDYIDKLHARKSNDYGDSFGQMWERFGIVSAIIRISDKINRIYSLTSGNKQMVKDESLRDTFLDLATYSLMTVMEIDIENAKKREPDCPPTMDGMCDLSKEWNRGKA